MKFLKMVLSILMLIIFTACGGDPTTTDINDTTQQPIDNNECEDGLSFAYVLRQEHPRGYIDSSDNKVYLATKCYKYNDTSFNKTYDNYHNIEFIGTFTGATDKYTMYYSEDNRPEYKHDRYAKYMNTEYYGISEGDYYASKTKEELISKVEQEVKTDKCERSASNYDNGDLNNYDNFWTYFCPKQGLITYLRGNVNDSNNIPTVNAGEDQNTTLDKPITITGSANDSDGSIVSYEWKNGDTLLATTESFTYTPTVEGNYTLTLSVMDSDGESNSDSMELMVVQSNSLC